MSIQHVEHHTPALQDGLRHCIGPSDQISTIPPECYASSDVLDLEQQTIFRNNWVSIGRSDIVKKPGDYVTLELAGVPLIILRDNNDYLFDHFTIEQARNRMLVQMAVLHRMLSTS